MDTAQRRLYLRATAKLLFLVLVCGIGYALLRSLPGSPGGESTQVVDLDTLETGETLNLVWERRRVIVLRRGPQAGGAELEAALLDPHSRHSTQPTYAETPWRSADPEYFVALDYGTDLNCPLDYIPATTDETTPSPWAGGFRDRCRGSWYDAAGRVYRDQAALRNLAVPVYRVDGHTLTLGAAP